MRTFSLLVGAALLFIFHQTSAQEYKDFPTFLSSWEKDFASLLSDPFSDMEESGGTANSIHTKLAVEPVEVVVGAEGGPGRGAGLRHAARQHKAWQAVRRRAPLLLDLLQARLAGIRAHLDILRHTLDLEQELRHPSGGQPTAGGSEQLGSRQQLLDQLGQQLASEGRVVVEDLLELRQLYANLRSYFGVMGSAVGHRRRREADGAAQQEPPTFLCHNATTRGPIGSTRVASPNIYQLRPQDIGILGSMGDSIITGTAAAATSMMDVFDESRGLSFITGADANWQTNPTLGNFLKAYNPFIQGLSVGTERASLLPFHSEARDGGRGLNVGSTGAIAKDMAKQATSLVKKVRAIHLWEEEWKLFTIMVGQADLCAHSCNATLKQEGVGLGIDVSAQSYSRDIEEAIDILRKNMTKSLVLLISPSDISSILTMAGRPATCALAQFLQCPCFYEDSALGNTDRFHSLAEAYRRQLQLIAAMEKFHTEDFAVVYVSLLGSDLVRDLALGPSMQLAMNEGLVAPDCLNLGQKAQGRLAQLLWNQLFPRGKLHQDGLSGVKLNCPAEDSPYLLSGA